MTMLTSVYLIRFDAQWAYARRTVIFSLYERLHAKSGKNYIFWKLRYIVDTLAYAFQNILLCVRKRIPSIIYDCWKMECLFVIKITKLYKTCLAAIKFQFARIYLFSKYAPYWEWEHFSVKCVIRIQNTKSLPKFKSALKTYYFSKAF